MVASFSSLPRELRDHIYDAIWHNTTISVGHPGYKLTYSPATHDPPDPVNHALETPLWLLTSKRIQTEAVEQFFRHAICTRFLTTPPFFSPRALFPIHRVHTIRPTRYAACISLDLAFTTHAGGPLHAVRDHSSGCVEDYRLERLSHSPSHIEETWLRPDLYASVRKLAPRTWAVVMPDYDAAATDLAYPSLALGGLIRVLQDARRAACIDSSSSSSSEYDKAGAADSPAATKHALRDLALYFRLPDVFTSMPEKMVPELRDMRTEAMDREVDLSYLENLVPRRLSSLASGPTPGMFLDRVEFLFDVEKYHVPTSPDASTSTSTSAEELDPCTRIFRTTFRRVQDELVRVGKVLVGGSIVSDKQGFKIRDWIDGDPHDMAVQWHVEIRRDESGDSAEEEEEGNGKTEREKREGKLVYSGVEAFKGVFDGVPDFQGCMWD